ncbi:MAG: SH3 domain-containing protein [Cyanobacteria bacterium P01_F01_bin.116]
MVTVLDTQLSQRASRRRRLWWSGFVLIPMVALMLANRVEAQQRVRVIQAPFPYNACNLRTGAGTQHSVAGTFRNGTAVTLLGQSGRGWYRVQVGQTIGWMARQCLGL